MLISDVIMADLNGIDAAIQIRAMLPGCKILLFSGQAATADLLDRVRVPGPRFEILASPSPQDLLARLRSSSCSAIHTQCAPGEGSPGFPRCELSPRGNHVICADTAVSLCFPVT